MSNKEVQQKSDSDLVKYIREKREELRSLRFGASGSGVRNTQSIKNVRKEVARSLTELARRNRESGSGTS